jgi:hypothetical protein
MRTLMRPRWQVSSFDPRCPRLVRLQPLGERSVGIHNVNFRLAVKEDVGYLQLSSSGEISDGDKDALLGSSLKKGFVNLDPQSPTTQEKLP